MLKITPNMPVVCPLSCPVGVHSITGNEQWSHSFPDEHFDQGPQGFLHWRKVQDLHGTLKHQTWLVYCVWSDYIVADDAGAHQTSTSTEGMYTYFPFSFSTDCYGVSRHGVMWIYNEYTTLCWQVYIELDSKYFFSAWKNETWNIFRSLAEWRNWMAILQPVEQPRHKSL